MQIRWAVAQTSCVRPSFNYPHFKFRMVVPKKNGTGSHLKFLFCYLCKTLQSVCDRISVFFFWQTSGEPPSLFGGTARDFQYFLLTFKWNDMEIASKDVSTNTLVFSTHSEPCIWYSFILVPREHSTNNDRKSVQIWTALFQAAAHLGANVLVLVPLLFIVRSTVCSLTNDLFSTCIHRHRAG